MNNDKSVLTLGSISLRCELKMSMFIYICQTSPHFQFTKNLNNWIRINVYLVVCSCLLVVCGHMVEVCGCLLVFYGPLWLFAGCLWSFADGLGSFDGDLWLFASGLRSFVVSLWSFAGGLQLFVLVRGCCLC